MGAARNTRKFKVRKNDTVMVVTGRDRGKTGKVLRVLPVRGRVIIERLNMVKRHTKPRGAVSPGGIVEKEAPIDISNVMVLCDRCNAPVRIGFKPAADGSRARICRRCGDVLGSD
ncbi:MAG: 50S ribosomal protein L24 [Deltaproteobacteria bacterium]|nr:50S ribosomal protein L24 [Deltaproteobacteria bacterium]MBV8452513.1 50S ribosomal protein L24 [Deltaproteobacteria bacterium]